MIYVKRFFKAIWIIIAVVILMAIGLIGIVTSPLTFFICYIVKGEVWDFEGWFNTLSNKFGFKNT